MWNINCVECVAASKMVPLGPGLVSTGTELVSLGLGLVSKGRELVSLGSGLASRGSGLMSLGSIYHLESYAGVSKAMNCLVSQTTEDCLCTWATSTVSSTAGSPPCCSLLILLWLLTAAVCVTSAHVNPLCGVGWSLQYQLMPLHTISQPAIRRPNSSSCG